MARDQPRKLSRLPVRNRSLTKTDANHIQQDKSVQQLVIEPTLHYVPILFREPYPPCGIGAFNTGYDDKFAGACAVHDYRYTDHENGTEYEAYSRERADGEFLNNMLRMSGDSEELQFKAYLYYATVRAVGWLFW